MYAPGLYPMDFHAVTEAFVDGQWRVVDGTLLALRQAVVRIATGRDLLRLGKAVDLRIRVEDVKKLTAGVGVDAALKFVGTNEAMQTALAICTAGAIVGNVGLPHGVEIHAERIF